MHITVKVTNVRQVAQLVEPLTLEVEVWGSKWWGRISPKQPYPKGAMPVVTKPLKEG